MVNTPNINELICHIEKMIDYPLRCTAHGYTITKKLIEFTKLKNNRSQNDLSHILTTKKS